MASTESTEPDLPAHLRLPRSPSADPQNLISGDHWRISVLDAGLVRLQWSPSGRFDDLASQAVLHRDGPAVNFTTRTDDRVLEVITDRLHLSYDRGPFSAHGLSVAARGAVSNYHSTWRYGSQGEANLGGTARTLDLADGAIPLEDGVLGKHGIACYDDSHTVLLGEDGWFVEREPGSIDLYVFAYGRDYPAALRAFYRLTGPQPQLPRWALGNWWSRYHPYTDAEYLALLDRFAAENLPFSVAVVDMDWHHVQIDPRFGSGWTGYSWNRDLFPDPVAFAEQVHDRGLKLTLNVHPADGIRAHEDVYPAVATAMGYDPADELPVTFDPTSRTFLTAYLEQVHHPLERDGVDFWWLDWQQGRSSRVAGLDPLWLLNHLHFLDAARPATDGQPAGPIAGRPITFSRYAGVGSHRYPVGFSGDSVVSWASLAFQPEFTARASNVGYGWWSHDIGGHMFGYKDDELATRWVQLGVFSPLLRLHSTADVFNSKEPWRFGSEARAVMAESLRLRHRLLPYLATMARRAHVDDRPLVSPLYYEHPQAEEAFAVPNEFYFGTSVLVAPLTAPRDRQTRLGRVDAWLPPGDWVDLFTGVAYSGGPSGRMSPLHRDLSSIPVLAPAGTLLPLLPAETTGNSSAVPAHLELLVVAGADGEFTLAEDADDDRWAFTTATLSAADGRLSVSAVDGDRSTVGDERRWTLVLVGFPDTLRVTDDRVADDQVAEDRVADDRGDLPVEAGPIPGSVRVEVGTRPTDQSWQVSLSSTELVGADVQQAVFDLLDAAQVEFGAKTRVWKTVRENSPTAAAAALPALDLPEPLVAAVTELLLAR